MNPKRIKSEMQKAAVSGDTDRALELATKILSATPHDRDAVQMKACILSSPDPTFHNPDEALRLVAEAVANAPRSPDRWVDLGEVQSVLGDYSSSQGSYRKALELGPHNYDALIGLSSLASSPGGITDSEAQELLEHAVEVNPGAWWAYYHLANLFRVKKKDYQTARRYYALAVRKLGVSDDKMRNEIEKEIRHMERLGGPGPNAD